MRIFGILITASFAIAPVSVLAQTPAVVAAIPPVISPTPTAVVTAPPVIAQTPAMIVAAPTAVGSVLPAGTTVRLRMLSSLSSQDNKTGQQFDLEAAEDVMFGGRVVIPRGSPAIGELSFVKKKGMWGKSGKLEGRIVSVRINGRDIALRGSLNDKGVTGTAGVIGAIAVLPLAGFFITGTSAEIPSGTTIAAKTESDLAVAFAP